MSPHHSRPLGLLKAGLALSLSSAALAAAWRAAEKPGRVDTRHEVGVIPGLPPSWEGQRVALVADFQVGRWQASVEISRRALEQVVAERPAVALIAGDLIYHAGRDPKRVIGQAVDLVRPLVEAGIPGYAVLGNHDYAEESTRDPEQRRAVAGVLEQSLEEAGIRVLRNAAVPLPGQNGVDERGAQGPPLYLVGIDEPRVGEARPDLAFQQVPADAPRLVLMHNPRSFRDLPGGWAPLALAGHTHGGQIRVWCRPAWTLARLIKTWPNYRDGWIEGYGRPGNRLYINRGLGFSVVPVRIGCPSEVTFFTLFGSKQET